MRTGPLRPPGGGAWQVGAHTWPLNPRHTTPRAYFHIIRLWSRCRSGMGGMAALPEPGGINQQPAWLIAAFGILDAVDADLDKVLKGDA